MNKKTLLCCLALPFLFLACSKGYDVGEEYYSGSTHGNSGVGRLYMLNIADALVIDNLKTLENALYADHLGGSSTEDSASYEKGGKSLRTQGATWKVTYLSGLVGLTITADGDNSWTMRWDDDMDLDGNTYPTKYTLTATCTEDMSQKSHFNWEVTLDGSRTEREGYACHFWTRAPLLYEVQGASDARWASCTGILFMEVSKNGKGVDGCTLQLQGPMSNALYRRGSI